MDHLLLQTKKCRLQKPLRLIEDFQLDRLYRSFYHNQVNLAQVTPSTCTVLLNNLSFYLYILH